MGLTRTESLNVEDGIPIMVGWCLDRLATVPVSLAALVCVQNFRTKMDLIVDHCVNCIVIKQTVLAAAFPHVCQGGGLRPISTSYHRQACSGIRHFDLSG